MDPDIPSEYGKYQSHSNSASLLHLPSRHRTEGMEGTDGTEGTEGDSVKVHLLPCCIQHNGKAPVLSFFRPKSAEMVVDDIEIRESTFRGRKLLGATFKVPKGYKGLILKQSHETSEIEPSYRTVRTLLGNKQKGDGGREGEGPDVWKLEKTFNELTYWNHDRCPTSVDPPRRCLEWLSVASEMHRSVSLEDVEAMINKITKEAN